MKILIIGGTRFMGVHLTTTLLQQGHEITLANRGVTADDFADRVRRVVFDRNQPETIMNIPDEDYDLIFDNIAYSSAEIEALLNHVHCRKLVQISTGSVYRDIHLDTREEEFEAETYPYRYCEKTEFDYGEIKRQAECAIVQKFPQLSAVRVRFPLVTGPDDYSKRVYFYLDHLVHQKPMRLSEIDTQLSFVRSDEAGRFLAFLGQSDFIGAINGGSPQTISVREILDYAEKKTGLSPVISEAGDPAPFNGGGSFSLNVEQAEALGYTFTPLKEWIYDLIDHFIETAEKGK